MYSVCGYKAVIFKLHRSHSSLKAEGGGEWSVPLCVFVCINSKWEVSDVMVTNYISGKVMTLAERAHVWFRAASGMRHMLPVQLNSATLLRKAIQSRCICVIFRAPSGGWWWVWWSACAGWCWSLPSLLPDVALRIRHLRCYVVSTTSTSPFCSAGSRQLWLPLYRCLHHRPPTNRCAHMDTINSTTMREVSLCKYGLCLVKKTLSLQGIRQTHTHL